MKRSLSEKALLLAEGGPKEEEETLDKKEKCGSYRYI